MQGSMYNDCIFIWTIPLSRDQSLRQIPFRASLNEVARSRSYFGPRVRQRAALETIPMTASDGDSSTRKRRPRRLVSAFHACDHLLPVHRVPKIPESNRWNRSGPVAVSGTENQRASQPRVGRSRRLRSREAGSDTDSHSSTSTSLPGRRHEDDPVLVSLCGAVRVSAPSRQIAAGLRLGSRRALPRTVG